MKEKNMTLTPEAIKAIEEILLTGSTAEIRAMENGVVVTQVYRKRRFPI